MAKKSSASATCESRWPLDERPGFLARRMHQIHSSLFGEFCGEFGITPVQYSLMTALAERGSADQTTLARDVALDRTTTTGALKRLILRGYVVRTTSQTDRRSQDCRLTHQGRDLLTAMEALARRAHEATVEMLSDEEQSQLIALLKRVVAGRRGSLDVV